MRGLRDVTKTAGTLVGSPCIGVASEFGRMVLARLHSRCLGLLFLLSRSQAQSVQSVWLQVRIADLSRPDWP